MWNYKISKKKHEVIENGIKASSKRNKRSCLYSGISIIFLLMLTSCNTSGSSKDTVNNYLKEIKQDASSRGGKHRCINDPVRDNDLYIDIKNWEITGQERTAEEGYPDSEFDVVYVKITETTPAGFDVTNTWKATVWKSDELFEHQKRFESDTDKLIEETDRTINELNKALGIPISPTPVREPIAPNRSEISLEEYCVTGIERGN